MAEPTVANADTPPEAIDGEASSGFGPRPEPLRSSTWIPWAVREYRASRARTACARSHLAADLAAVARSREAVNAAERDHEHWRERIIHAALDALPIASAESDA